jgi:hypothetical protein
LELEEVSIHGARNVANPKEQGRHQLQTDEGEQTNQHASLKKLLQLTNLRIDRRYPEQSSLYLLHGPCAK